MSTMVNSGRSPAVEIWMVPTPRRRLTKLCMTFTRADVPERYRGAVLAQDSLLVEEIAFGDGDRGRARLDVPNQQDEDAGAEGGDQQDRKDEPEGMGPEHGRVRLVNHLVRHPYPSSVASPANLVAAARPEKLESGAACLYIASVQRGTHAEIHHADRDRRRSADDQCRH